MSSWNRAARVFGGQLIIAITFGLILRAHLGLGPLHVLQQGITRHTGISLGLSSIVLALAAGLLAWALRERPGIGTVAAVVLGGVLLDAALPFVPTPHLMSLRIGFLVMGTVVMAFGAALYMSALLGASPYDSLMNALFRQVPRVTLYGVRLAMELAVFLLGWAAGGEIGLGTLFIGVAIGPCLELWLRLLKAMPEKHAAVLEVAPPGLAADALT